MTPIMQVEAAIIAAIYPPFMFTNAPIVIKTFVTIMSAWVIGYAIWHIIQKRKKR